MNMQFFGKLTVLVLSVHFFVFINSTKELDRLKARVKHLETRLNAEFTFRDEDISELTNRLDGIDKVLNETFRKGQTISLAVTKAPTISLAVTKATVQEFETAKTLKDDFTRLKVAFKEEKSEAIRFRREIPKIENSLISINEDIKKYCKVALNNTDQLLTNFETVKHVSDDNIMACKNESKLLQSIVEQVHLNSANDKSISKQIENIETLVNNLSLKLDYLFLGPSCRSLKEKNNLRNGIYKIMQGFEVYCDQTTYGGGWIVFQRRQNGETDFYRNWIEYKNGFGDLEGEFWLGNEYLSQLTSDGVHELRIEMEDFEGNSAYAKYSKFKIYPEEDNYKLEVSGYSGTGGDSFSYHDGMMFSTFDRDQDESPSNCAKTYHGAWWHKNCHYSNLNGQYYNQPGKDDTTGINWFHWKNKYYCLKKVEMKFR